jgi:hypothetical protein
LSNDRALLHESLGARCLWESHWREEWCGIYETCVSFYAPSTKSPCLEISFIDVTEIRPLDPGALSPLPGFHLLVLETSWLCHYIAFRDKEARDAFGQVMEDAKAHSEEGKITVLSNGGARENTPNVAFSRRHHPSKCSILARISESVQFFSFFWGRKGKKLKIPGFF